MSNKRSVIAKLTCKPGTRDDLVAAFGPMFEQVGREAGTELYVLSLDAGDENVAWVTELYTDEAAMGVHSGSDAMAALFGAIADLLDGTPELSVATPVLAEGVDL